MRDAVCDFPPGGKALALDEIGEIFQHDEHAQVTALAIIEPLSEHIAHRVEQIERVSGARAGEPLTPTHIARLLASEEGLLKGVGGAKVVPVINMV